MQDIFLFIIHRKIAFDMFKNRTYTVLTICTAEWLHLMALLMSTVKLDSMTPGKAKKTVFEGLHLAFGLVSCCKDINTYCHNFPKLVWMTNTADLVKVLFLLLHQSRTTLWYQEVYYMKYSMTCLEFKMTERCNTFCTSPLGMNKNRSKTFKNVVAAVRSPSQTPV